MSLADVTIVIPTWKGRHLLEAYLPSVLEAGDRYRGESGRDAEIVIVEDAGGDGTPTWLRNHYPGRIRLLEQERNGGFSLACRTGFEAARHPLVLLLNNDVRLRRDCIAPLAKHFTDHDVFAVTGKLYNQAGDVFCNGGKIGRFRRGMWSTYQNYDLSEGAATAPPLLSFTAIGAFSMFDRAKFMELGGFDPMAAMIEDVEISWRGWKRGWTVKYEPRSVAYHDASRTMGRRYRRRTLDGISRRSRILMHWALLHDRSMFGRHLLLIGGLCAISWLILDWRFYWAIATGLGNLPAIRRKRRHCRRTMKRSDRELDELLGAFYRTAPISRL